MSRWIDGDALIAWIKESQQMTSKVKAIIAKIKTMPSEDRPHGEWEERIFEEETWTRRRFYCSSCGDWQTYGMTKYCPNCGAKMDGERKTDD